MASRIRIGARGSRLSMAQTGWVAERLRALGHEVEIIPITTTGDRDRHSSLAAIGGQGLFVKEIEAALQRREVDLAVHSLKDLPTEPAPGLTVAAVPERESPADALVTGSGGRLEDLSPGARVGTSSTRRRAQLQHARPDLEFADLRGNLDTRLRKLEDGQYDAIIAAAAGLRRLGIERAVELLPFEVCLPAPGQGALAVECREDDEEMRAIVPALDHAPSRAAVTAERAFLRALGGGCEIPVGALGEVAGDELTLTACVVSGDGKRVVRSAARGLAADAEPIGETLAAELLDAGAREILAEHGERVAQTAAARSGVVYLVGAGPGDPGLITVRGLERLRRADVIVHDNLANPALLREARSDAEVIYVGKQAGRHSMSQDDINRLLYERASVGKSVCRLKGGDPFVFGRGGEEAWYLAERGVAFEIVPGVSSAVAVPAYAGIPVTDRRWASAVAVVTGHEGAGKEETTVPWAELAGMPTIVFLMGMGNLAHIAERLTAHGRAPDTPVALIRQGTLPDQVTVTGTLADIADRAEQAELTPPVVIVVGEVVRLRESLRWFDTKPLFGLRVLVTRAREQASALSARLSALGAMPIEQPTIRIEPIALDGSPLDGGPWDWVVFTSPNGVEHLFRLLSPEGADARALAGSRIAAIGPGTAEALAGHGIAADFVPDEYTSEALAEGLPEPVKGARILIPRADAAPEALPRRLRERGAEARVIAAYRTVREQADAAAVTGMLERGEIDVITFTSSSTVNNFVDLIGRTDVGSAAIACIGPVTERTARERRLRVDTVAEQSTIEGLVDAIVAWHRSQHG